MSIYDLDRIFHPKSVAVIGAPDSPGGLGAVILRNLIQGGYKGAVYPIGLPPVSSASPGFQSLTEIAEPVDLAVLAEQTGDMTHIIRQCAQTSVGGLVIFPAAVKLGHAPQVISHSAILAAASGSALRIIGPGSLGLVCSRCQLNITIGLTMPPAGRMAFISQSGALATAIFDSAEKERIGFSHFVSLGSMCDLDFGDVIDYLGNDGRVSSIVMYIEQLKNGRRFMSAARAVSSIKPIIALKAGRTEAGARAASRHTGAAAARDGIYDAALKRAGILRVRTFEELFDCAELMAKQPQPQRPNLLILSNGGGPAVMAVDALADYGIAPAPLRPEIISRLDALLTCGWSRANPVDIGGEARPELLREVTRTLLSSPQVDGLLIMLSPQAFAHPTATAEMLVSDLKSNRAPVLTAWMGGGSVEAGRNIFNQAGIPTFDSPERAVRAFVDLYHYGRNLEILSRFPPSCLAGWPLTARRQPR